MRPFFLRGYMPTDFCATEGHAQPAVAVRPHAVPLVTSEGGARLDTHRVLPAQDWLSDDELGQLRDSDAEDELLFPQWRGQSAEERSRRAEMRERLRQVREESRVSRREWLVWLLAAVAAIAISYWLPEPWAGYGWHVALAGEWF